jgi:hypothetical protein
VYHLKQNARKLTYSGKKLNHKQVHPHATDFPNLPRDTRRKVTLAARPLRMPVAQKLCGYEHAYSRVECVFIVEHYFASKSFAAVREAISSVYPDKEVLNKTTVHQLVTKFRDTASVCL